MELCLIDCMIKRRPINFPYIIMKNLIMENDQKQKFLPYSQCLTTIFEHFDVEFTDTDRTPYFKYLEIDNRTLTNMKFV